MTTYNYSEFALKVIKFICEKYDKEYVRRLDYLVIPDGDVYYYKLTWELNQQDYPFVMQGQFLNEDKFFDYVVKQIRSSRIYETEYFVTKRDPNSKVDFFEVLGYKDDLLTFDEKTLA